MSGRKRKNVGSYFSRMSAVAVAYSTVAIPVTKVLQFFGFVKVASEELEDLEGKIIVITGANTGIGKAAAKLLADKGATVILACRSMERANAAVLDIISDVSPNNSLKSQSQEKMSERVKAMQLDVSDLDSVRTFASSFCKEYGRLDILINNAGLAYGESAVTKQGIETVFGTNYVGHFLLTTLLLDLVKASNDGRIVNLSSVMHHIGTTDIVPVITGEKKVGAYPNSKLAMLLFSLELRRRLAGTRVLATAVNPGFVASDIWRHIKGSIFTKIWNLVCNSFALRVEQGATVVVAAASWPRNRLPTDDADGMPAAYLQPYYLPFGRRMPLPFEISGPFAGPRLGFPSLPPNEPQQSADLWRLSEELCARVA